MIKRSLASLCMLLLLTVPVMSADNQHITIVAGPVAGTSYIGMGALGKIFTDTNPGAAVTLQPGSDIANPIRLEKGEVDFAAQTISLAVAAREGVTPFKKPVGNLASLINLHTKARLNIVVRAESGIESIEQIKEKKMPIRLAHGPRGSGSEVFGRWVLAEYGMDFKDISAWGGKLFANDFGDVANMLKDGQVDMMFWMGPGEAWFLTELINSTDVRWLSVTPEVAATLDKKYRLYPISFPAEAYGGKMGREVPTVGTSVELMVRKDLSDNMAYLLTKAACEGRDDIVLANSTWSTFTPETAWTDTSHPLHPGAEKYYREKGYMK